MLTHFGNFLCVLGEKGPFKTGAALWSVALGESFFIGSLKVWEVHPKCSLSFRFLSLC